MENRLYKWAVLTQAFFVALVFISQATTYVKGLDEAVAYVYAHYMYIHLPFGALMLLDQAAGVPMNSDGVSYADVLMTPMISLLSFSMWCGIVLFIIRLSRRKAQAAEREKGLFWKRVFLANLLLAAIAFISILLLLVTNLYEPSDGFSLQWLYARQMEITLATVTGSFITGTCWLLTEKLWKRNRAAGVVMASAVMVGVLAVGFVTLKAFLPARSAFAMHNDSPEAATAAAAVADAAAYPTYRDTSIAERALIRWDGPAVDRDSLSAVFRNIFYKHMDFGERRPDNAVISDLAYDWYYFSSNLQLNWHDQNDFFTVQGLSEALNANTANSLIPALNYAFHERHPRRIRAFFDNFGDLIYDALPERAFRESFLDRYVQNLINLYYELKQLPDYEEKLAKLYNKMNTTHDQYRLTEQYLPDLDPFRPALEQQRVRIDEVPQQRVAVWYISFWARRHAEGNMEETEKILEEINLHYNDQ